MDSSLQKDQDDLRRGIDKKRILVVDDEKSIRDNIKSMLEDTEFYSVQTAQDGEEAINFLKQQTFNLLITDYNMPKMNGYELFKKSKSISSNLPVIFITGNNFNEGVIDNIKSQGNIEFIHKPFEAYILFKTVVIILNRTNT